MISGTPNPKKATKGEEMKARAKRAEDTARTPTPTRTLTLSLTRGDTCVVPAEPNPAPHLQNEVR